MLTRSFRDASLGQRHHLAFIRPIWWGGKGSEFHRILLIMLLPCGRMHGHSFQNPSYFSDFCAIVSNSDIICDHAKVRRNSNVIGFLCNDVLIRLNIGVWVHANCQMIHNRLAKRCNIYHNFSPLAVMPVGPDDTFTYR